MKTLVEQLSNYAKYHRDKRNIYTHFIGIPMIVFAILVLLSRPVWHLQGVYFNPAMIVSALACIYYLKLSLSLGVIMAVLLSIGIVGASMFNDLLMLPWLGWGIGLFVVGWVFQFVGHYFEGKKPAFVDDLIGLVIGPLFVVAELLFMIGLYTELEQQVVANAGETR